MRKLPTILFLLLYAGIQPGMLAWDYYKPIVHFICYRFSQQRPETAQQVLIKTDYSTYKNCRQDDQEIRWQGRLYDIKQVSITGNEVLLVAEKDDLENKWMELFNTLRQRIATDRTRHWPAQLTRYQWLFKLYVPAAGIKGTGTAGPAPVACNGYITCHLPLFSSGGPYRPPDGC